MIYIFAEKHDAGLDEHGLPKRVRRSAQRAIVVLKGPLLNHESGVTYVALVPILLVGGVFESVGVEPRRWGNDAVQGLNAESFAKQCRPARDSNPHLSGPKGKRVNA